MSNDLTKSVAVDFSQIETAVKNLSAIIDSLNSKAINLKTDKLSKGKSDIDAATAAFAKLQAE